MKHSDEEDYMQIQPLQLLQPQPQQQITFARSSCSPISTSNNDLKQTLYQLIFPWIIVFKITVLLVLLTLICCSFATPRLYWTSHVVTSSSNVNVTTADSSINVIHYDVEKRKLQKQEQQQQHTINVFLLAGQSNMVGMGSLDHMKIILKEKNNTAIRNRIWDEDQSTYKIRSDVYMKNLNNNMGPLTLGPSSGFAHSSNCCFGTEVMFGWTIGDYYASSNNATDRINVVLLKYAYDGQSLAVDFRPPSSGIGTYNGKDTSDYGRQYRKMIPYFQKTIQSIPQVLSSSSLSNNNNNIYTNVQIKITGFVWLQGWKDMKDAKMVQEYSKNLANFINDVRKDLNVTNLPFVVGELGQHGRNVTGNDRQRVLDMRTAQENTCKQQPYTTKFVHTAQYTGPKTNYDMIHHHYGRADTYSYIGRALGLGMINLVSSPNTIPFDSKSATKTSIWKSNPVEQAAAPEVDTIITNEPMDSTSSGPVQPTPSPIATSTTYHPQPKPPQQLSSDIVHIATLANSFQSYFSNSISKFKLGIPKLRR